MRLIAALACLLITRGVGIYPGDPAEDYAPILAPDNSNYRNLALLRPAYHSSSYDYNLTAQLVTDGIKETKMPRWLVTTLQTGVAKKNEREFLIDHNTNSNVSLGSQNGWMQFGFAGGEAPLEVDRIDFDARISPKTGGQAGSGPGNWSCLIMGSEDGKEWSQIGSAEGAIPPSPAPMLFGPRGSLLKPSIKLAQTSPNRIFRIELKATIDGSWTVNEVGFFNKDQRVEPGGLFTFNSSWKPEGIGEEWVYVDLGSHSTFDHVALYWIRRAAEGMIQVSDDAKTWKDIQPLPSGADLKDDLKLRKPAQGRYVRVLLKKPESPEGYILSELEVCGRGGLVAKPDPKNHLPARADGGINLASWRLQRDSLVEADGSALSKPGFQDSNWILATVPATVLSSYWNAGALPDPNYGANQLMISDSFFCADFWYRAEFTAPAGYGDQNLYSVELKFDIGAKNSDSKSFQAGVRQFTYSEDNNTLKIWINGRRFVGRGGNWGFPETNLRYRGREYDIAVGYHQDMNFTMIRNWVGQTGDEEFYEACDRHGIVIWQDFWLANPVDGPDPDDNDLFLKNAKDFMLRIRNHPSVGLYCGRNEGNPPKPIDDGIRKLMPEIHPDLHYISNSAMGVVSGGGPYAAQQPKVYFKTRATTKLHSELGMPNIVTFDSLKQMMPESALWPQGLEWGLHDFNLNSAQRLSGFQSMIDKSYGGADNPADWVGLAQFINYDGYRAIFEAQGKNRMGVLLWMSHPCWPSFVWQTYDYYFDPTAGYFGSKKGSEPLHIQWNSSTDDIEVVNYNAGNVSGLTANVQLLNMDASVKWEKSTVIDSVEDSILTPVKMEFPERLSAVHFIKLKLKQGDKLVSENFYWRGVEDGNFTALRSLPKVELQASTKSERQGNRWVLKTEMNNASKQPALMVRLKAVRAKSGDRILPAYYSDNFISLMPGERKRIVTRIEGADTRGESPRIVIDGFNIK